MATIRRRRTDSSAHSAVRALSRTVVSCAARAPRDSAPPHRNPHSRNAWVVASMRSMSRTPTLAIGTAPILGISTGPGSPVVPGPRTIAATRARNSRRSLSIAVTSSWHAPGHASTVNPSNAAGTPNTRATRATIPTSRNC